MWHVRILVPVLTVVLITTIAHVLRADDEAVQHGRDSLRSDKYPWYDSENDSLRRVDVPEIREEEEEEEDETEDAQDLTASDGEQSSVLGGLFQVLFWLIIIVLFAAVIGALLWAFLRADQNRSNNETTEVVQASHEVDRIENLPFKIRTPQSDLLAEAERHYKEGNYREAVIYLYSYKLVELDKHHRIRLSKGKTNRQYLREIRTDRKIMGILERTMVAFEDVFFGQHELSRRRFEDCWNSVGQFRSLVGQGGLA
jgi:hypothetical protein